ncbi:MAG: RNase adapter RapZ [Leptospirillum sp.]
MDRMHFLFVSGLSGAGKSHAIQVLEDLGYFCVENLPSPLLSTFAELLSHSVPAITNVAIGIDIRERGFLDVFLRFYEDLKSQGRNSEILFLEADDSELIRRFSETRRPHPLSGSSGISLVEAIQDEREKLASLKSRADRLINTTGVKTSELKTILFKLYGHGQEHKGLKLFIMSFGFKYGVPIECDMVLDVRFLPNPYYVPELREKTGLDESVCKMVFAEGGEDFLRELQSFLSYLLPNYISEGRSVFTLGLGCTGGKHRSVALAQALGAELLDKGYDMRVIHRDLGK